MQLRKKIRWGRIIFIVTIIVFLVILLGTRMHYDGFADVPPVELSGQVFKSDGDPAGNTELAFELSLRMIQSDPHETALKASVVTDKQGVYNQHFPASLKHTYGYSDILGLFREDYGREYISLKVKGPFSGEQWITYKDNEWSIRMSSGSGSIKSNVLTLDSGNVEFSDELDRIELNLILNRET